MGEGTMKSWSKRCEVHPGYLEQLAEAEGSDVALPPAASGCALCAANLARHRQGSALLRGSEEAPGSILSADWQAEVWLRLGEEHRVEDTPRAGLAEASSSGDNVVRFPSPSQPPSGSAEVEGSSVQRPMRWLFGSAAALLLVGALVGVLVMLGGGVGSEVGEEGAPHSTLVRGGHAIQPANPPKIAEVASSPMVELKAWSVDSSGEGRFDSLEDGATIRRGDQLSFDYATASGGGRARSRGARGDDQYLTVVAVVRSRQAQEQAVPEDKQLLWLVESKPVRNTGGELSALEEEDIRVDAPAGEMTIYGLVSDKPVPARAIEDALILYNAAPTALPGVGMARLDLRIEE